MAVPTPILRQKTDHDDQNDDGGGGGGGDGGGKHRYSGDGARKPLPTGGDGVEVGDDSGAPTAMFHRIKLETIQSATLWINTSMLSKIQINIENKRDAG